MAPHVEPEQGVFYVHGAGLFVDNHLVEIGVAAGLLQPVVRRELGKLRIRQAGLPAIIARRAGQSPWRC